MTTTREMPDDPQDCCRVAHKIMDDDFHSAKEMVGETLTLMFSALCDDDVPTETLRVFIGRAQDMMDLLSADLDKVQALIRHGMVDYRRSDAIIDARCRAVDEGRDPDAAADEVRRAYDAQQEGMA